MGSRILPYYESLTAWDNAVTQWKAKQSKNNQLSHEEYEDFFFSAFSRGDYKSYKEVCESIIAQHNKKEFHIFISKAIEHSKKGLYKKSEEYILQAIDKNTTHISTHPHVQQLLKEVRLRNKLSKIKSQRKKIQYLNTYFFEISGNILYSIDILGLKLLLESIAKTTYDPNIIEIKESVQNLYEKTKYFKRDMTLYNSIKIKKESLILAKIIHINDDFKNKIGGIHWIIISKILSLNLLLKDSYSARRIAKDFFVKNKERFFKNKDIFYLYSFRACLENDIPCSIEGFLWPEKYKGALINSYLYQGKMADYRKETNAKTSLADEKFYEYIKNKKIAIVGPVNCKEHNGIEIDSHDIVIRLNTCSSANYPEDIFGKKTDISYYLRRYFESIHNELDTKLEKLKFIVFHANEIDYLLDKTKDNQRTRATLRYHSRTNNCFFSGYGNFIQRITMDLLRFQPKSIKIFNTNLWLDVEESNYYVHKQKFSPENIIMHDILSNFIFTKKIHELELIEADKTLSKILSLSPEEYLTQIINKHANAKDI